ncbi:Cobalamin adenosyltransferase [Gammaproteobacteria bacterium]
MGYRLTKICTRTGDQGTTGLADGSRISKDGPRVHALGDVDELNCTLGVLLASDLPNSLAELFEASLSAVQNDLFDLGAELALPGHTSLTESRLARLEQTLEGINADLPSLREFVLPGGCPAAAACHLARSVCRRAERSLVALTRAEAVNPMAVRYLNRLSDLLFVMARALNHHADRPDVLWKSGDMRN